MIARCLAPFKIRCVKLRWVSEQRIENERRLGRSWQSRLEELYIFRREQVGLVVVVVVVVVIVVVVVVVVAVVVVVVVLVVEV